MQALNIIATGNKSKGQTTAYPDEAVFGLELLGSLEVVIDEAEASGLASSEVGAELEDEDGVGVLHLVHLGKPLLQLRLHTENKQNNPEIQARSSRHMSRAYRTGAEISPWRRWHGRGGSPQAPARQREERQRFSERCGDETRSTDGRIGRWCWSDGCRLRIACGRGGGWS